MEKIQEKREVKSREALSVLLMIAACIIFFLPAWNEASSDQKEFTMHRAESLAYQIIEVRIGAQREPANEAESALNHLFLNEGVIGSDTWGQPYRFKVLKNASNQSRVLVWSLGPNGNDENSTAQLDLNQRNGPLKLAGDDLGIMLSIN